MTAALPSGWLWPLIATVFVIFLVSMGATLAAGREVRNTVIANPDCL
jgi:hypothetical protein